MIISQHLDTRRPNKKGLFPVKIRVSYSSKADLFPTGHYLSVDEFNRIQRDQCTVPMKKIKDELDAFEGRVKTIISRLQVYSVESVRLNLREPHHLSSTPVVNDVVVWFKHKYDDCIKVKQSIGNAECYDSACKFYKKYFSREVLPFELFTAGALYEIQRSQDGKYSLSTIGKYARHLRTIFNLAIAEGFILQNTYPFGVNRYIPPTSRKRKHALSREALIALIGYEPFNERERFHLDMFLFSFYGNGLNMKDVATLKWKDMGKFHLTKKREKTRNTNAQEPIKIYLIDQLKEIITRHSNEDKSADNYIFPLLDKKMTNQEMYVELKSLRGKMSRTLTGIGKVLGIEGKLPHGTSRHCFANALKQGGASAELISETIGHSSAAITKHYTSDFEESGITYQNYLINYIKPE